MQWGLEGLCVLACARHALQGVQPGVACQRLLARPPLLVAPAGSLEAPGSARRRQLLSASGAASFASIQSALSTHYDFNWTYLPPQHPNITSGAASDFDVSLSTAGEAHPMLSSSHRPPGAVNLLGTHAWTPASQLRRYVLQLCSPGGSQLTRGRQLWIRMSPA